MKIKFKFLGILFVSLILATSCEKDKLVNSVTLNRPTLELGVGKSYQLVATILPDDAYDKTVQWKSSDNSVATVDDNGKVTAVKVGNATITATAAADDKTAKCEVTVSEKQMPENMVFVKGGTFGMGNPKDNYYDNERPYHQVTVSDFYIGKYEVTNGEYANFLNAQGKDGENGYAWIYIDIGHCQIELVDGQYKAETGKEQYPVLEVSWFGAMAYAEWLGCRLPTEAEWEYAAKGGTDSNYKYAGSDNADAVAWYIDNSINPDNEMDGAGRGTHIVGTKRSNGLGIYDMSGNAEEWCSDWYGDYTSDAQINPTGPTTGNFKVVRGGEWGTFKSNCRVISRTSGDTDIDPGYGFRIVYEP